MVMNFLETFATQANDPSEAETCVDASHAAKTSHRYYRVGLEVESTGQRKVGRPVKTWRKSIKEEMKKANITGLGHSREDGGKKEPVVDALCSMRNQEEQAIYYSELICSI